MPYVVMLDDNFHYMDGAGALRGLAVGSLVGPIRVPGDPLFDKPADLYLGKIVRRVTPPGP